MSRRREGIVLLMVGALVLAVTAYVNYETISEAYGAGPPYYSRTTNMDKWSNPWPELLVGNVVAALVARLILRAGIRKVREHRQ
ncbi:hypothetical protein [Nitrosospira briensis]|uniref:hypothetical protein n=1 Tax=Nitrosospira briensis TaxID=35799 RepID=UPI0008EE62EB|nr:hypothetical protein [Nitrosospira briensis]SFN91455.1 hypothetical protein SAMN05216332_102317 [Nitrosospira briensis]